MTNEKVRPQGSVIEPVAKIGGVPVVTPLTGYDGHYPVKFSDETDAAFAGRVAQFEGSYASAKQNALGGKNLEQSIASLKAKYDADVLNLQESARLNVRTVNGAPVGTTPTPTSSKRVETAKGKTKVVDADYVLEDGESFV